LSVSKVKIPDPLPQKVKCHLTFKKVSKYFLQGYSAQMEIQTFTQIPYMELLFPLSFFVYRKFLFVSKIRIINDNAGTIL